jgi:catechol 2,3-dioxygenase-like lactoylglutathione lyase family enzyme
MLTGVQDIYYNVSDMTRAVDFYQDVLGMKLLSSNEYWSSLEIGGVTVGLHWTEGDPVPPVPGDAHGPHAGATLTLQTDSFTRDADRLKQSGVKVLGELHEEWGDILVFQDPDGNYLKLMQPAY